MNKLIFSLLTLSSLAAAQTIDLCHAKDQQTFDVTENYCLVEMPVVTEQWHVAFCPFKTYHYELIPADIYAKAEGRSWDNPPLLLPTSCLAVQQWKFVIGKQKGDYGITFACNKEDGTVITKTLFINAHYLDSQCVILPFEPFNTQQITVFRGDELRVIQSYSENDEHHWNLSSYEPLELINSKSNTAPSLSIDPQDFGGRVNNDVWTFKTKDYGTFKIHFECGCRGPFRMPRGLTKHSTTVEVTVIPRNCCLPSFVTKNKI